MFEIEIYGHSLRKQSVGVCKLRKFSIVLADDEQNILFGMKKGIPWEELGFEVVGTAQNGKEALELIEEYHPDLLISDIKMPFMDGLELAKNIHESYMTTKVILFSGWDDFEYARLAISYGVSEYIMKPINFEEMKSLLVSIYEELEKEYAEKLNRNRLEKVYEASLPLLRQQFFSQVVTGSLEEDYREQQMKNLKLNFDFDAFYMIAVKLYENDSQDVLSELSIKETIKDALEKIAMVYQFTMMDKDIFLLCSNKKHDIERITRTIEEVSFIIRRIFHVEIFCGISTVGNSIKEVPALYKESIEALDYNLVIKEECYTYYNDILPLQNEGNDWSAEVEGIEKIITYCTEDELESEVMRLLKKIQNVHYNLNEYQIVILEILFAVSRLHKKYQIGLETDNADTKMMAVEILSLETGEELNNWLIEYCKSVRKMIQKKQIDNNAILASNAIKIVQNKFRDSSLSVESICEELHVSSSHFSKIFKQEIGVTFLNYLINLRMEEAKRLLLQTDYKSQMIGEMVGYPEPNYFSYVFKKNCGVSPAKYRKLEDTKNEN